MCPLLGYFYDRLPTRWPLQLLDSDSDTDESLI